MAVEAIGNPPPEADQLRAELEEKLPHIISSFSQVLQEEYGFKDLRVGGFSVVPVDVAVSGISCNEKGCDITQSS